MALYSMGVQLLMLVARGGLSGENSIGQTLSFAFPTDQFYDLVCTYKNLVAGFVGVCMSLVNTLASWESQVSACSIAVAFGWQRMALTDWHLIGRGTLR